MMGDITVVIPTRNRFKVTVEAIKSVLNQTLRPQSIIVVDDASDDQSFSALKARFPKQVQFEQNATLKGANFTRNFGASLVRTKYIAFLDSDDRFFSNKLKRQVGLLEQTGLGFSCTGFVDEQGKQYRLPKFSTKRLLVQNCLGGTSGLVIRRTLFNQEKFEPDMPAVQDWELYLRLVRFGPPAVLHDPLFHYGLADPHRITHNNQKRAAGHAELYQRHIKKHPQVTNMIDMHHKILWKNLSSNDTSIVRLMLQRAKLRMSTKIAYWL